MYANISGNTHIIACFHGTIILTPVAKTILTACTLGNNVTVIAWRAIKVQLNIDQSLDTVCLNAIRKHIRKQRHMPEISNVSSLGHDQLKQRDRSIVYQMNIVPSMDCLCVWIDIAAVKLYLKLTLNLCLTQTIGHLSLESMLPHKLFFKIAQSFEIYILHPWCVMQYVYFKSEGQMSIWDPKSLFF